MDKSACKCRYLCCQLSENTVDVTQLYFSKSACMLENYSKSENELLSMNFKGKCAVKLVHCLPKLELSRNLSSKVIKLYM